VRPASAGKPPVAISAAISAWDKRTIEPESAPARALAALAPIWQRANHAEAYVHFRVVALHTPLQQPVLLVHLAPCPLQAQLFAARLQLRLPYESSLEHGALFAMQQVLTR